MEDALIKKLLSQYSSYSNVHRSSIQPNKLALATNKNFAIKFEDNIIRESLLEHVGHLPITAVSVYPYINNSEVDLGKALIMLSIHDIAELETGDIATFTKTAQDYDIENNIAIGMLDADLQKLYLEMDQLSSATGKFAKSIDKMVADILDLLVPVELSVQRYASMGIERSEIVNKKREKKLPYMLWNPFLESFYNELLQKMEEYFAE